MVVLMRTLTMACLLAGYLAAQDASSRKPDQTVSITAERYTFTPATVKVKEGELVELVFSSDDTDHGVRLPSADVDAAIPQRGKGELRIRFIAHKRGRYVFECSRPCGAGHNLMRGEIVVE
jgi:cytochrome c oxidase subunit 2